MKLFCGGDPVRLQIEDAAGAWHMSAFRQHIETCDICGCGLKKILGMVGRASSLKKAASSAENGKKGGRPRKVQA